MNENVKVNPIMKPAAPSEVIQDSIELEPILNSIEVVPRRAPIAINRAHQGLQGRIEESKEVVVVESPEEIQRRREMLERHAAFERERRSRFPPELVALFARPDAWNDARLVIDFSERPEISYTCGYGRFELLPRAPGAPDPLNP